jgi:hypothetical protein
MVLAMAAVLLVAGALLAGRDDALGAVGLAALAYGIGLLVAGAWLAAGHNPLDRRRKR